MVHDGENKCELVGESKHHLFLTGERGVGKSTLIRAALGAQFYELPGFVTQAEERNEIRVITISKPSGQDKRRIAQIHQNGAQIFEDVFGIVGMELTRQKSDVPLTVMDELGFLESHVPAFTDAVLRRLQRHEPIIGVLRALDTLFLREVKELQTVQVLEVTAQNRKAVLEVVRRYIDERVHH